MRKIRSQQSKKTYGFASSRRHFKKCMSSRIKSSFEESHVLDLLIEDKGIGKDDREIFNKDSHIFLIKYYLYLGLI